MDKSSVSFSEWPESAQLDKTRVCLFNVLEKKNSYLLEFHKINMDELSRLADGCIDNLENFYYSRELLLNAINKLDSQLKEGLNSQLKINKKEKQKLLDLLHLKQKMVMSILEQDLIIMSLVNQLRQKDKDIFATAS